MRKVNEFMSEDGVRVAKVYRDAGFDEFVVRVFVGARELVEASYHTSDKADAEGTARLMVGVERGGSATIPEANPETA